MNKNHHSNCPPSCSTCNLSLAALYASPMIWSTPNFAYPTYSNKSHTQGVHKSNFIEGVQENLAKQPWIICITATIILLDTK